MKPNGRCKGHRYGGTCRAPILWAVTEAGETQPIDPDPDPRGHIIVEQHADGQVRSRVETMLDEIRETREGRTAVRYMPHHATCADVDLWRAKQRYGQPRTWEFGDREPSGAARLTEQRQGRLV